MSDLGKILSFVNEHLGPGKQLYLRWEGAGDCQHPAYILGKLHKICYRHSEQKIRFNATINIYEGSNSSIYTQAVDNLNTAVPSHYLRNKQEWALYSKMDVQRSSQAIAQPQAHIMFVRNIMPTNEQGDSLTRQAENLKGIHKSAILRRRNSLRQDGNLRIGMSGAPGLVRGSRHERDSLPARELFSNAGDLVDTATGNGYTLGFNMDAPGSSLSQRSPVMANNGNLVSQSWKSVYYMTFVNSAR